MLLIMRYMYTPTYKLNIHVYQSANFASHMPHFNRSIQLYYLGEVFVNPAAMDGSDTSSPEDAHGTRNTVAPLPSSSLTATPTPPSVNQVGT